MGTDSVLIALFAVSFLPFTETLKENCQSEDLQTLKCNYFPRDIPNGVDNVYIEDFKAISKTFKVKSSSFQAENWADVKYLELSHNVSEYDSSIDFESRCFHRLKLLQELHIHLRTSVNLDPETFTGLDSIKVLDMSGCVRLNLNTLVPSLRGEHKLSALENLKLSGLHRYRKAIAIDEAFAEAMKDKTIKHLDFSDTAISVLNMTAVIRNMRNLQVLNISFSFLSDVIIDDNMDFDELKNIIVIDVSHVESPFSTSFGKYVFMNQSKRISDLPIQVKYMFASTILNVSTSIPQHMSLWVENCTTEISEPLQLGTEELISRHNNIKSLDVKTVCSNYTALPFKHLDFAQNGLEFLHPSLLSCMPNLTKLDLSTNKLFKMGQKDHVLFGQLITSLQRLKSILVSSNNLKTIPNDFFEHNYELETIDLSHNQLDQVTFTVRHLKMLMMLDLQNNNIKTLDKASLNRLDPTNVALSNNGDAKLKVLLRSNPISCSYCKDKTFIQWLTGAKSVNTYGHSLYCIAENGEHRNVNSDTIHLVQKICQRKITTISSSVAGGLTSLLLGLAVAIVYKRRKWAKREARKNKCLRKLREGQGQYEFVVFLSHSSEDLDFVEEKVKEKLNENLKLMTGIDRDMVCTGDQYLRPGFLIFDETVRCMERATVVMSVISKGYCESNYCHNELDQAYRLNKPIILMLKEQVDENLMMPTMRMLFKNNVRILWTIENDEYVLKTTWGNVCESILDLISSSV